MPESRQFSNVVVTKYGPQNKKYDDHWFVYTNEDPGTGVALGIFDPNEWDLAVIFTKKSPKFKPGDRVDTHDVFLLERSLGTIVGVYGDRVGVVWDINPAIVAERKAYGLFHSTL